jgi:phosphate uptake regulator
VSVELLGSAIADNLRFLILEARDQLLRTRSYMNVPSDLLAEAIAGRVDYVGNLRRTIQRKVFGPGLFEDEASSRVALAAERVAQALNLLSDHCQGLVAQVGYLEDEDAVGQLEADPFFALLLQGVDHAAEALFRLDANEALAVCRVEARVDELYEAGLSQALEELENGEHPHTQLTLVFLLRHLEAMGDALLEAGEAILSACLGESIKAERLWALEDALGVDVELEEVALREIAETRSGSRIRSVTDAAPGEFGQRATVIVKDGSLAKLEKEREGNSRWRALDTRLAPATLDFQRHGDAGAIVYEYAPGATLEDIVLLGTDAEVAAATQLMAETLHWVWTNTRIEEPSLTSFLDQLERRLPAVYAVHPDFRHGAQCLGKLAVPPLEGLLATLREREDELRAPFRVFVHGDLNLDNVLYEPGAERVSFLDLHRTHSGDYAQDVSVLLVSYLRLNAGGQRLRWRLGRCTREVLGFCRGVASAAGDETFDARLALGMARSFATSTRFLLDSAIARSLFLRARYLLECLLRHDPKQFRLPEEVLDV